MKVKKLLTNYIATPSDAVRVEVPETIGGYPVTGLEKTFYENQTIETIVLPEGIRFLGENTFNDCETLSEINFPASLEEIGEYCFYNTGLEEVVLPASIKKVETNAFAECRNLIRLDLSQTEASYGNYVFADCEKLMEIILPDTLETIFHGMFQGCVSLEEVKCPKNLKWIKSAAFRDCSSLQTVYLSNTLESIEGGRDGGAFMGCVSLKEINLPDSLKKIGTDAFLYCSGLQQIRLPDNLESLGNYAFGECDSLEEFIIPANLSHEKIGTAIVTGKKIKKIINNTPYALDKRIYLVNNGPTWYADENCTRIAESLPAKSAIYRSKAELYANICLEIFPGLSVFTEGVDMEDMNTREEVAAYLCTLLPASEEVTFTVEFEYFRGATKGTKTFPSGNEGYAEGIIITVQNKNSQIDKVTVRYSGKITIHPVSYESSGAENGGGSGGSSSGGSSSGGSGSGGSGSGSSGSWGSSSGGSSSGGSRDSSGAERFAGAAAKGLSVTKPNIDSGVWNSIWKLRLPDGSYASAQWGLINGKWYLFGTDATMLTGWQMVNGIWYYLEADGSMATGWKLVNDKWYYLNQSGDMAVGWKEVAGKWYYFDSSGAMLADTVTPDGYTVNASGERIP